MQNQAIHRTLRSMLRRSVPLFLALLLAFPGAVPLEAVEEAPGLPVRRPALIIPNLAPGAGGWLGEVHLLLPAEAGDAAAGAERSDYGLETAPDKTALGGFYGDLVGQARAYSVWGTSRVNLADPSELANREVEIERAADRIFSRAADDFLGRKFDLLIERSQGITRFRQALDHYTSITFRGLNPALGADPETFASGVETSHVRVPRRVRTTASLQVDLHPKLLLKSRFGHTRARLEMPLSGSEYRLVVARPLSSRVASELFAAYPRSGDGNPRAGVHLFLTF